MCYSGCALPRAARDDAKKDYPIQLRFCPWRFNLKSAGQLRERNFS
jgi:hypothetical protein